LLFSKQNDFCIKWYLKVVLLGSEHSLFLYLKINNFR
jgi:hypothetical protein